ncbi:MAG: hypothetical protein JWM11_4557 [Planctomycetaceae bacterium]|nr:hypothetical protein [Planctomycetaceae bacterium]
MYSISFLSPSYVFRRSHRASVAIVATLIGAFLSGCRERQEPDSFPAVAAPTKSAQKLPQVSDRVNFTDPKSAPNTGDRVHSDDWFEDVTAASGVNFTYRNGQEGGQFYILESLGGGAAVLDFDRDGDLEVFLTGGGTISGTPPQIRGLASALFRNEGQLHFTDVTLNARLTAPGDYSHGCFAADFNCDGYADILVTAYGRCRLFRNQGDGTFDDVSASAAIDSPGWSTAAAWGDIDRDGFPDLFVTEYLKWSPETDRPCWNSTQQREVCSPNRYPAADDRCYRNRGDGTFEDMTRRVGLSPGGNGLGVIAAEINGDGLLDFYVANDETDNFLYLGSPDGTLKEVGQAAGVAVNQYGNQEGSMGVEAGDYDGDGLTDLWVTNFELEDNALYRNLGQQLFSQTTNIAGLAGRSRLQVGFGTALEDFNGDGWLDLLVINGHVFYAGGQLPYRQKSQLFRNAANGRFEEESHRGGTYFRAEHPGRGAAVGDLDNDGGLDLVIVHQNEPASILRNRNPAQRFARLELVGVQADRDAIGAVVSILVSGRDRQVRLLRNGAGYFSQFDQRILIPLQADSCNVDVRWPGGITETYCNLQAGQTHCLIQGRGAANASQ